MTRTEKKISFITSVIVIISIALTVAMMPKGRSSEFADYKEGVLSPQNVIAPFDFEILRTEEELSGIREKVKTTIPPVFVFNDTLNLSLYKNYGNMITDFDKLFGMNEKLSSVYSKLIYYETKKDSLSKLPGEDFYGQKSAIDSIYQMMRKDILKEKVVFGQSYRLNFDDLLNPPLMFDVSARKSVGYFLRRNINDKHLDTPKASIFNRHLGRFILREASGSSEKLLNDFTDIEYKRKEVDLDFLLKEFSTDIDNDTLKYWSRVIEAFSRPAIVYSAELTDSIMKKVQDEIPLAEGLVKKGDEIISRNMVVTKHALKVLRSLDMKIKELEHIQNGSFLKKMNIRAVSGKILISSLFYFVLLMMLFFNRKKILYNYMSIIKLFTIILIQLGMVYFSLKYIENFSPYLVTMSVTSVLIAIFFDMRVSFTATVITSILSSLIIGNNYMFVFIPMFSGLFTMYALHHVRDIFQFIYKNLLFSFIGLLLPGLGFSLIYNSPFEDIVQMITHSAINSAVSPLIALTLLTIIEKIFKTPTDVTLLQLSDMSNPLLKHLQVQAPGTYHHSVTVGNLAEAAAEAIGANSLLARVGAYYHDIGKSFKPAYFIENQQNMSNKHDKMSPNMSAFVLSGHVKDGIKLANEHKLPEVIIDFIRMHHGASRMEFFYNKAVNLAKGSDDKINESIYRYPGPKPNSKETAIVMIADIVEAKCRTESGANADRFRQIIKEIILDRFQSGELDECDIKLNDLTKIREAMIPVITGMYHQRIKYPDQVAEEEKDNEKLNPEKE
jgi:cyclic-di-AMP phosphodiesterase PgpH